TIDRYLASFWENLSNIGVRRQSSPNQVGGDILLFAGYLRNGQQWIEYSDDANDATSRSAVFAKGVQLVIFEFEWEGASVTLRVEQHTEYVTSTTVIDLSQWVREDDTPGLHIQNLATTFRNLNSRVSGATETGMPYSTIHKNLYEEIWDNFYDSVLAQS